MQSIVRNKKSCNHLDLSSHNRGVAEVIRYSRSLLLLRSLRSLCRGMSRAIYWSKLEQNKHHCTLHKKPQKQQWRSLTVCCEVVPVETQLRGYQDTKGRCPCWFCPYSGRMHYNNPLQHKISSWHNAPWGFFCFALCPKVTPTQKERDVKVAQPQPNSPWASAGAVCPKSGMSTKWRYDMNNEEQQSAKKRRVRQPISLCLHTKTTNTFVCVGFILYCCLDCERLD